MTALLFIWGLFFWSFGYALICRIHNQTTWTEWRSLMMGRSIDDRSNKKLQRYQLIPVISRLLDRYNSNKKSWPQLSIRYPISEIGMWCIFVWSYWLTIIQSWGVADFSIIRPTLLRRCSINRWLFLLIIYDIKTYELHLPVWIIILSISLISQFFGFTGNYVVSFWMSLALGWVMRCIYHLAHLWMSRRMWTPLDGLWRGDIYVWFLIGTLRSLIPLSPLWIDYMLSITQYLTISGIIGLIMGGIWYIKSQHIGDNSSVHLHTAIPFIPALIIGYWSILIRYTLHSF